MAKTASENHPPGIVIVVENLPVPFDRRVWQEATTLSNAGYRVAVICPVGKNYQRRHETIDNIEIYRHPLPVEGSGALSYAAEYSAALFWQLRLLIRIWRKSRFTVIHACNPPDTIFIIGAVFKLLGVKFLFDHHDINPELYIAKFGRKDLFYRLMLLLERLTFKTADISLATNESYRDIALTRGRMAPDEVTVVRSGPNLERVRRVESDPSLARGKPYLVGYVGVMGQQEGIDYLLNAIEIIVYQQERTDIHFCLVGDGTALSEMRQLAADLNLSDYVTFTGRVSDEELLTVLSTADVCVNPDVANEMNDKSTMNKIMEYMALGKPIVQFDLTEGRYSAQDASLYAARNDCLDFANKIIQLIDDHALRDRMGAYGKQRVEEKLSWEHEAPKLLAAYRKLLGAR